ncbi:MAG: hypothetical protein LBK73_12940 [Treponema sp.]|nr:hypothetical protein [Treponema sp.]
MHARCLFLSLTLLFPLSAYTQEHAVYSLEAARYRALAQQLTERHIPFEERELFSKYGGFGSSIYIFIPAASQNPPETTFALAVPLAGTGGFAFEAALDFAEAAYANARRLPIDVRIAFLGDEASSLPSDMRENAHIGLQDLYDLLPYPEQTALWYLYMENKPQKLNFVQGASGVVTPLQMLQNLPTLCQQYGVPYVFPMTNNELFHLKLVDGPDVYAFSKARGINALVITDAKDPYKGYSVGALSGAPMDMPDASVFADMLLEYTSQLDLSSDPDTHYMMISNTDGKIRFISGIVFIIVLIAGVVLLTAFFLALTIAYRRLMTTRWHIFFCYFWIIPLHLALLALAFGMTHLFLFAMVKNLSLNIMTALLFLTAGMLLYTLFFLIFDDIAIPGKPRFYGYAAIIAGLLDTLILMSFNTVMMPLCTGAFAFILIGALWKNPIICYLAGVMAPLQAFGFFYNLLKSGGGRFLELVMDKNIVNVLIISILFLPSLFVFRRGQALLKKRRTPVRHRKTDVFNRSQKPAGFFIYAAVLIILLTGVIQFLAFYAQAPAHSATSAPVRRVMEENGGTDEPFKIHSRERLFLARRILDVRIETTRRPIRFDMALQGDGDIALFIYSAVFENKFMPYRQDEERQNRLHFILGENPPDPFSFTLVIPADFSGALNIKALYNFYDAAVDNQVESETEDYILAISKSVGIANNTR